MITSCDDEKACWSKDGKSFFIKNVETFSSNILPQYFKHSKFSSFVRQLNFYGFTKTKDVNIKVVESHEIKYWQFHHRQFQRSNPELLVKIVRRLSNNHGAGQNQRKKAATEEEELGCTTKDSKEKERRETDIVKKEIQVLKGKVHSMEDEMKKLTDIMSFVDIHSSGHDNNDGDDAPNSHVKIALEMDLDQEHIYVTRNEKRHDKGGSEDVVTWELMNPSRRIVGANKKQRILVKDSHLFGTGIRAGSTIGSTTMASTATNQINKQIKPLVAINAYPKILIPALAVSDHAASIDLPDLGLASNDTDLFLDDQTSIQSRNLSRSSSARLGSIIGFNEPLHSTCDDMEVDDIISLLESDIASAAVTSTTQDQPISLVPSDTEFLPVLVADEGSDIRSVSTSNTTEEMEEDLLDQNHLLNLENCLSILPLPDRINFVQDVMKKIHGMDDFLEQGMKVVAKSDSAIARTLASSNQIADSTVLSELESLLIRVGLTIELDIHQKQSTSLNSSRNITSCVDREGGVDTGFLPLQHWRPFQTVQALE